jgi:hypothetical protein
MPAPTLDIDVGTGVSPLPASAVDFEEDTPERVLQIDVGESQGHSEPKPPTQLPTKAQGVLFGDPNAPDLYDRLGLGRTATQTEIEKAFRKTSRGVHPDKHPMFKGQAEEFFQKVNEAYQTLGDESLRKLYDREHPPGCYAPSAPPAPPEMTEPNPAPAAEAGTDEPADPDDTPIPCKRRWWQRRARTAETTVPVRVREVRKGVGCWIGCLRDCHVLATLISLCVYSLLGLFIACKTTSFEPACKFVEANNSFFFWFLLACTILCYLYEVLRSSEWFFLAHIKQAESADSYIQGLKDTPPIIWWNLQCYHFENVKHETTEDYRDDAGQVKQRLRTESYEQKVVTHTARCLVQVSAWEDVSEALSLNLQDYYCTKITLEKKFSFADHDSKMRFEEKKKKFIALNNKDTHHELKSSFEVAGFEERILASAHPELMPKMLRLHWFVLFSLCLMTVPYRLWFSSITGACRHCIHKELRVVPQIQQ